MSLVPQLRERSLQQTSCSQFKNDCPLQAIPRWRLGSDLRPNDWAVPTAPGARLSALLVAALPCAPRVVVLLSTYQGERFVAEQLQSILGQLPANGRLLVRDDGSRDRTAELVEQTPDPRITLSRGENVGFGASFLTLLSQTPDDVDMVMFADQDDVWLPGKLERAWQHLRALGDVPALYGGAKLLVDKALRPLGRSPPWPRPPSFRNALSENIITGCTAAINQRALTLMKRAGVADGVQFHDWWLYLVISAFGVVVHDEEPTLLYRQHSSNQIGQGAGLLGRYAGVVQFLWRRDWVGILLAQTGALVRHYGDSLDPGCRHLVLHHFEEFAGQIRPRWRLILGLTRWRQLAMHEIPWRLLLALHRMRLWPPPWRRLR